MSEGLPKGWALSEIGNIGKIVGGGTPNTSEETNFCSPPDGIPWLSPFDLSGYKGKYISHGRKNLSENGYKSSSAKLMPTGTVVFSSRAPIGYVAIAENPVSTNQGFRSVIPHDGIYNVYLYYYLFASKAEAEKLASGSTFKEISGSKLQQLPILLPPLNEQKRIVAKLDAIMPRIDAVKEQLYKVPDILKRFRQSVLTAAVTGRLTEQWREEHKDAEEVDFYLKMVIKKRISDFNQQILNSKKNKILKPPRPNYLDYSFESDTEKINELPTTWIISKVGLLCDSIVPGRDKPKSFTGSIPWITLPEIIGDELNKQSGKLKLSASEIKEVNARVIPAGSVVMCCVGNFGISALVNDPIVINQQLHAFVKSEIVLPKYLMYHLKTLKDYQESISTSTTIAYLNKTNCNSLPINLPPLEEQKEIVRQVDKLFALADKVEAHYQKAKARVDKLSQSVLAKAFRGELVPQDPNDEPAEKLLERILEEKAKMEAELKGAKKKVIKNTFKKNGSKS